MKSIWKLVSFFALLVIFTSCKKTDDNDYNIPLSSSPLPPPPRPSILTNQLSGKEFIFDTLTWVAAFDDGMEEELTFVNTPSSPDLFALSSPKEVYLKVDSSSQWTKVQNFYRWDQPGPYYWYYINYLNLSLRVLTNELFPDVAGKKATVRIKFL